MNDQEKVYLDCLKEILDSGESREDRTGIGTISKFGMQLRFDLRKGFPAITTKRLAWKAIKSELLWFIEGSSNEERLQEILYGDVHHSNKTIWQDNLNADYWIKQKKFPSDLGRIYGVQWRTWRAPVFGVNKMGLKHVDQLVELINGINNNPLSRRHIITAWNPGELHLMSLPPCHMMAQFYVGNDNSLSCQMYQRSADMFLGVPFNIASYALFTHMIAQVCNLSVKELIIILGDAHIYHNHVNQVNEQLSRTPFDLPNLQLNTKIKDITKFTMDSIELINYQSHPSIKADMAV